MKITIKKIKIENFKGCKNLEINLNGNLNIEGANATGKSTVADAFTWCLFGKNASQEKDFNIKNTVDTSLNQAEHSVEITLAASDGLNTQTTTLRRTYREKWSKIKGSDTATYTGNETLFYWNEVPMAAKDYAAKVELILPESLFKLLTNPMYFNNLKWNERRAMLMGLVQESGFDNSPYTEMLAMLAGNKTIDELKREVAASKKKAKEALELIPARKDELLRLKVEVDPELPGQIATVKAKIEAITNEINSGLAAEQKKFEHLTELTGKKNKASIELQNLEVDLFKAKQALNDEQAERENKKKFLNERINGGQRNIENNKTTLDILTIKLETVRAEWKSVNATELGIIAQNNFTCPTCNRPHDAAEIEAISLLMAENFKSDKARKLAEIKAKGDIVNAEIKDYTNAISQLEVLLEKYQNELAILPTEALLTNIEIDTINASIATQKEIISGLEIQIEGEKAKTQTETKQEARAQLAATRDELDQLLQAQANEAKNADIDARLNELTIEQRELAQQLSNYEKTEYQITQYTTAKINYLTEQINSLFEGHVRFKMFENQINGGQTEVCETLVKRVPWQDANTEGKLNAGLQIIKIFGQHYGFTAPIIIDNRESVTNIIPLENQLINLIVNPFYKSLHFTNV